MLGSLFFLFALLILGYVLKYRVHVHLHFTIEITSSRSSARNGRASEPHGPCRETRKAGRRAEPKLEARLSADVPTTATTRPVPIDSVVWGDIQSALENLGAPRHRAKAAAQHVVRNWPDAGFDVQLREAINEVRAA